MHYLLEFFESGKDILFDKKLDEDILKPYFLDCLLKVLIRQDDIIRIAIDEQDGLILYFSMTSSNAGCFQILFFAAV